MRFTRTAMIGLVAITLSATACSNAAPGGDPGGSGAAGGSKTLRINYGDAPYSAAVLNAFTKQHPDIKVQVTHSTLTFEDGSVQTNLRSGRGADVILVNSGPGRIKPLAQAGLIADLSDSYAGEPSTQYPAGVLDQITTDGKIYEVVEGRDIFQLHYQGALFAKAGVQPPKTWTQLLATCKPLTDIGVQPLVVGARDNFGGGWLAGTLLQSSAGSKTMNDVLFGKGTFAQSSVVAGATKLKQLVDNGCVDGRKGLALKADEASASFGQRKAAMIVTPQSLISGLTEDKVSTDGIGAMSMPSDTAANVHPTSGLAVSWIVNAKSPSLDAAKQWIKWVSSEQYLTLAAQNGYTFAPTHLVPDSVKLDPAISDAVDAANTESGFNPSVYLSAGAKEAWYAAVQGLLSGKDAEPLMQAVDTAKAKG